MNMVASDYFYEYITEPFSQLIHSNMLILSETKQVTKLTKWVIELFT